MRILCEFGGSVGEMVDALAAAEVAVNALDNAKIYFKVKDERMAPVAKAAWFTKSVLTPDQSAKGFDITIDLTPDRERTHEVEITHRQKIKEIVDTELQAISQKMHMPVDKLKKPEGYAGLSSKQPIWDRMMGYLIRIAEAQADTEQLSATAITSAGVSKPLLALPKGVKEKTNKYLHDNRDCVKPGVPYVVIGDYFELNDRGFTFPCSDGWGLVLMNQSTDPDIAIGIIDNPRCKAVISKSGGISRVAWAAGVPMILEFVDDPDTAYWTSVRSGRSATVDLFHEETSPETVANTIRAMYQMSHGIELE